MRTSSSLAFLATLSLLQIQSITAEHVEQVRNVKKHFPLPGYGGHPGGYGYGAPAPSYGSSPSYDNSGSYSSGGKDSSSYGGGSNSYGGSDNSAPSYGGSGSHGKGSGSYGSSEGDSSSSVEVASSTVQVAANDVSSSISTSDVSSSTSVASVSSSDVLASVTLASDVNTQATSTSATDNSQAPSSSDVVSSSSDSGTSTVSTDSSNTSATSTSDSVLATSTDLASSTSSTDSSSVATSTADSSVVVNASSTTDSNAAQATATSSVMYGSGSSSGSNSDVYNSCVQQCQVSSGMVAGGSYSSGSTSSSNSNTGSSSSSSSSSSTSSSSSSSNVNSSGDLVAQSGQVVVAPIKGDLRMVPFAYSGSSVEFVWGAGPHTVTQSSAESICEATKEAGAFKSGKQDVGFTFPVTGLDTSKPTFYYCGVPTHCEKGMFGVLNPTMAKDSSSSWKSKMDEMSKSDADFGKLMSETNTMCAGNSKALTWGDKYDMSLLPEWSWKYAMTNVMYTRQYYAQNPSFLVSSLAGNSSSSTSASSSVDGSDPATAGSITSSGTFQTIVTGTATASSSPQSTLVYSGASSLRSTFSAILIAGIVAILV